MKFKPLKEVLKERGLPERISEALSLIAKERVWNGEDPVKVLREFGVEVPEFVSHQLMEW